MKVRIFNNKVGAWVTVDGKYDLRDYIKHLVSLTEGYEDLKVKAIQYRYGEYTALIFHDFNSKRYIEMERARWEREVSA